MAFVGGAAQREAMREVAAGDIVLLKRGLAGICAVGEVVVRDGAATGDADLPWLQDFDGWDLSGWCHVDWRIATQLRPAAGLRPGTIYRTSNAEHVEIATELLRLAPSDAAGRQTPSKTESISDAQILDFLIREGLRPAAADELTNTLRRIRLLAQYYYDQNKWSEVREHETRTFLVIPLLLSLGWAEQQVKIELPAKPGRVDIACFSGPYVGDYKDCRLLIETKDFSSGLDYAPGQAIEYAKQFPSCAVIVVTNGYCYKLYRRDAAAGFSTKAAAYLNLLRPRDRYPIDPTNVGGALDVLKWLLPANVNRRDSSAPGA